MKALFRDILNIEGIIGVFLLSFDGRILYRAVTSQAPEDMKPEDWTRLATALKDIREADLIFDAMRLYIRFTSSGFLIAAMESTAPSAMVRLNCDLVIPALKEAVSPKRRRLFTKRRG